MKSKRSPNNTPNSKLLIDWALILQHQQLWINQIITSLDCPLLPGQSNQILQKLSAKHFETWLEEGVPLELVAGLLAASIKERTVRREIGRRLTGEVVSRLLDERAGQIPYSDYLEKNVRTIQSIFMIGKRPDKRWNATEEDQQEAQRDAYVDAWEELYKQTEQILTEPWALPPAESDFEAALLARWQEQVLPALKQQLGVALPALVNPEAVNYIPARVKKDRMDRIRHWRVDAMWKANFYFDTSSDDSDEYFFGRSTRKQKSAEDEDSDIEKESAFGGPAVQFEDTDLGKESAEDAAIEHEDIEILSQQINEAIAHVTTNDGPAMRKAVKFVLRGAGLQSEAIEKYHVARSTLNDKLIKARERVIEIRRTKPNNK
jgi:hypothetical protein